MQKISQKLSFSTNFFKVFGVDLKSFQLSRLRCLKLFPYCAYTCHVLATSVLIIWIISSLITDVNLTIRNNFAGIFVLVSLSISAVASLTFTFQNRQKERKFWNLVDQLDDFIVRFLDIKIDYKKENWLHLRKIFLIIAINFGNSIVIRGVKFSHSLNFNRYMPRVIYFIFVNQLVTNKFLFYVSILYNRFQLITENLNEISSCDYKVITLQHVHFIIWKLSKKIEKIYGCAIVLIMINVYTVMIFYTFLCANDMGVDNFQFLHAYAQFAPLINVGIFCYNCGRFQRIVSKN